MENLTSTTITWDITAMDCYPQADGETDVVFTVHWNCSGQQTASGKTYNGSVYSTCSLPAPTGSAFTPYDQLTETQVLGWIWAKAWTRQPLRPLSRSRLPTRSTHQW